KLASGSIDTAAITLASSGKIESQNYDSASSGFRLTSTGIQIKGAPLTISNVGGLDAALENTVRLTGYQVTTTGADNANKWGMLGRSTVTARYGYIDFDLSITGGASGASYGRWANLHYRVKQQNVMGSPTYAAIEYSSGTWFKPEDFIGIVVENSATQTVVEWYVKIRGTHETARYV